MCGIVGVLRYGDLSDIPTRPSSLYLAATLLELTETRGKDATGVAALFDDGNFFGQKMGIRASEFITRFGGTEGDFDGLFSVLNNYQSILKIFIGHCRKKTVGGAFDNMNNHPIKIGNIIGLHNGTLKNDDIIFKNLGTKRDGTVDSEAIFHLLNYYTKSCKEPFTLDMIEEVTKRLDGTFSFLAFNANNPNQLISARDDRPAEYCLIRPLKLVLIASEKKFIDTTLWSYNKLAHNFNVPGFVKLKDKDVEYAELKNETMALFDLTKEINEDTKLASLYETRDITKSVNRIWKVAEKPTYCGGYQGGHGVYNHNTHQQQSATNDSTDKEDSLKNSANTTTTTTTTTQNAGKDVAGKTTKEELVGRVWSDKLDRYVEAFGKKGCEDHIVIDTENKSVMNLEEAIKEMTSDVDGEDDVLIEADLAETDDYDEGELVKFQTPVEAFSLNESVEITTAVPIQSADLNSVKPTEVKEKDTEVFLLKDIESAAAVGKNKSQDILTEVDAKKIGIEMQKEFKKFETADEVAAICNTDTASLSHLPMPFLANRIARHLYLDVFVAGWNAKCASLGIEKATSKPQKHIRVLKHIASALDGILNEEITPEQTSKWLKFWKVNALHPEVSPEAIQEIFNAGDLRSNKTIRVLLNTLLNK